MTKYWPGALIFACSFIAGVVMQHPHRLLSTESAQQTRITTTPIARQAAGSNVVLPVHRVENYSTRQSPDPPDEQTLSAAAAAADAAAQAAANVAVK
jgi:hypothetical protein